MRLICNYLIFHKKSILLFFLSVGIFAFVFYLSNLPVETVLYAGLLCFLAAAAFAIYDFCCFSKHHKALQLLLDSIDSQIELMPQPRNLIDMDYTAMVQELHQQKQEAESQAYIERKELVDYFTLWAHQIKTPISAMGLVLQSREGQSPPAGRELSRELFNIEEYVNTAMSFVRLKDISSDLAFEKVSLDHLIRKALRKYAGLFIGNKVSMDFRETGYTAVTDEKWLSVVLGQVLVNALKYTPEGGKISIYMQEERLMVSDTGAGIPAEDLPRVFEKGFTGYNGRHYGSSTGQGLYLCKTIMDKLSHKIEITSRTGAGTTVILGLFRETFQ